MALSPQSIVLPEPIAHRDLLIAPLASGSRGNCTFIGDERSGVLVDCGLSTRQVMLRLEELGLGEVRIEGVLITHEHSDHVAGARVLDDKLFSRQGERVPFYLTRGTRLGLDTRCKPTLLCTIEAGVPFQVGRFTVEPFSVPHDTRDPVAYLVSTEKLTVGVLTDLGRSTRLIEAQVARMDVALLEFNHDLDMLLDGPYPWRLKQRVRGAHGHLSNAQAAEILVEAASDKLQHLLLSHLSEDNNRPELALEVALSALSRAGLSGVQVSVTSQYRALGPVRVGPSIPCATRRVRPSPPAASPAPRPELPLFQPVSPAESLRLVGAGPERSHERRPAHLPKGLPFGEPLQAQAAPKYPPYHKIPGPDDPLPEPEQLGLFGIIPSRRRRPSVGDLS